MSYKAVHAWSKVDQALLVKAIDESPLSSKPPNCSVEDLDNIYFLTLKGLANKFAPLHYPGKLTAAIPMGG